MINPPLFQFECRDTTRRLADRAFVDLQKTFSTPICHSCLERMADGVLLLDNETRVIYATSQVDQILKRHDLLIVLSPKFAPHQPCFAARFTAFVNGKNQEAEPLSLLLGSEYAGGMLLLNCFKLPKPADPGLQVASYMITLRDSNYCPSREWLLFIKQFTLTPAEARLCLSFADGLTLKNYCEQWKVATSTARSQLHSVFEKTSTHRQSDLLRLILLFSRS